MVATLLNLEWIVLSARCLADGDACAHHRFEPSREARDRQDTVQCFDTFDLSEQCHDMPVFVGLHSAGVMRRPRTTLSWSRKKDPPLATFSPPQKKWLVVEALPPLAGGCQTARLKQGTSARRAEYGDSALLF